MPSCNKVNSYIPSTVTGTLFHESIIKVYIQNITKYIYPKDSRKIIFTSNQYLCIYPNKLNRNLNLLYVS